ncbi:hypothetical protein FRC04_002102 [Tulasnella sp. 424]|nr:hypothetical protein FRC04_002102 [Tulasnella sp. 424]
MEGYLPAEPVKGRREGQYCMTMEFPQFDESAKSLTTPPKTIIYNIRTDHVADASIFSSSSVNIA